MVSWQSNPLNAGVVSFASGYIKVMEIKNFINLISLAFPDKETSSMCTSNDSYQSADQFDCTCAVSSVFLVNRKPNLMCLNLKVPITTAADNIYKYFSIFF